MVKFRLTYMFRIMSALCVLAFSVSCDEEKPNDVLVGDCIFDLAEMQNNYRLEAEQKATLILNRVKLFSGKWQDLVNNYTLENFREAKAEFDALYTEYQGFAAFDIGLGYTQKPGTFFNEWVNTFPPNTDSLRNRITQGNTGFSNANKVALGFAAIEFLLYDLEPTEQEALNRFENDGNAFVFVLKQAEFLERSFHEIQRFWDGNDSEFFVLSSGSGDGSPLALLTNAFIKDFEYLKNFKLKNPAGRYNGGVPRPETAEGKFSNRTIALAKANYEYNKTLFYGKAGQSGLLDYAACLSEDLFQRIDTQFKLIDGLWEQFDDPLTDILDNPSELEKFNELINEMQKLTPPLKAEMTSLFNVRITYQDNDGD